jgi:hypothetical protein
MMNYTKNTVEEQMLQGVIPCLTKRASVIGFQGGEDTLDSRSCGKHIPSDFPEDESESII